MSLRPGLFSLASLAFLAVAEVAPAQASPELGSRCSRLLAFYEWYGAGRKENSDGARHHGWIGASIDCGRGRLAEGIVALEQLLHRKRHDPWGCLQVPATR